MSQKLKLRICRIVMRACLFLAVGFGILAFLSDDFCVMGYGIEGITRHSQMNSFTSDEPLLILYVGIILCIFAFIMCFLERKITFFVAGVGLIIILAIPMAMFFTAPFYQVIYDSIYYCKNSALLMMVIALYAYLGVWIYYLLQSEKDSL